MASSLTCLGCQREVTVHRVMGDEILLVVEHGPDFAIFRQMDNGNILQWLRSLDKAKR